MEAAESGIHEGEAMFRGIEEEGVVVPANSSVEEGESLRGEEVRVGARLKGWLLRAAVSKWRGGYAR